MVSHNESGQSANLLRHAGQWQGAAPVDKWDPPYCGEMDMRIAADGTWYHEGTPIRRQSLMQLFASILRREADGHYYLVTPVEKVRIQVDDCPFVAVLLEIEGEGTPDQVLRFTLNTGETVEASAENPLTVQTQEDGQPHPCLEIRHGLTALISRSVFYSLADLGVIRGGLGESKKMIQNNDVGDRIEVLSHEKWFVLGHL